MGCNIYVIQVTNVWRRPGFPLTLPLSEVGNFIATFFIFFPTCYMSVINVVVKFVASSIGYRQTLFFIKNFF